MWTLNWYIEGGTGGEIIYRHVPTDIALGVLEVQDIVEGIVQDQDVVVGGLVEQDEIIGYIEDQEVIGILEEIETVKGQQSCP